MDVPNFGDLLREYRARSGLSQKELAELSGISIQAIGSLEKGDRRTPQARTVVRLANALGLTDAERAALTAAMRRTSDVPWTGPGRSISDDAIEPIESRLVRLLSEAPGLEALAKALQVHEGDAADVTSIQRFRHAYLQWYADALIIVPDDLQPKFRDYYEGGNFVHRIRHFLEAPTERNALLTDPKAPRNPLVPYWANPFESTFRPSFLAQQQVLTEALHAHRSSIGPQAADAIVALCRRFPLVVRVLRRRHAGRAAIAIENEYDVQDLIQALLVAMFDDVRPEESTPSHAGGASRMDFLLKREGVVVEIKMTRSGVGAREVRDQLATDLLRYQAHPDCQVLVCFVHDPDGWIANPRGFEQDLSKAQGNLVVRVAVVQG